MIKFEIFSQNTHVIHFMARFSKFTVQEMEEFTSKQFPGFKSFEIILMGVGALCIICFAVDVPHTITRSKKYESQYEHTLDFEDFTCDNALINALQVFSIDMDAGTFLIPK